MACNRLPAPTCPRVSHAGTSESISIGASILAPRAVVVEPWHPVPWPAWRAKQPVARPPAHTRSRSRSSGHALGSEALRKEPLTLNFKEDTLTTVSRPMLRVMASKLGFNETQTVLYALARLRDEVMSTQGVGGFIALTKLQNEAISAAEPRRCGRVVDSLLP
jgi:hypothetical protein